MAADEAVDFATFEQRAWVNRAKGYDEHFEPVVAQAVEPLLDAAGVQAGKHVLDLACGSGLVSAAASRRGARSLGVDFSPVMVDMARARYPWLAFEQADAHALPFEDSRFDAVVINFGMVHFADPDQALREAFRVLKPGGMLAFTDWEKPGPTNRVYEVVIDSVERHAAPLALPPGPSMFRFCDAAACREALAGAAFDTASVATRHLPLVWRFQDPEEVLAAFKAGSARLGARLNAQTPETYGAIAGHLRELCSRDLPRLERGELTVGAALTSARKPASADARSSQAAAALA